MKTVDKMFPFDDVSVSNQLLVVLLICLCEPLDRRQEEMWGGKQISQPEVLEQSTNDH